MISFILINFQINLFNCDNDLNILNILKKATFNWVATGRFAIDLILKNNLDHCDIFSIYVKEQDKEKFEIFKKKNVLKNLNVSYKNKIPKYKIINGAPIILDKREIEFTAPRYFNLHRKKLKLFFPP